MTKSSEAISDFPGTSPLAEKRVKPELRVVGRKPLEEDIEKEIKEEKIVKISPKKEKRIVRKVAAIITSIALPSTGAFITLGEMGNLPVEIQEWYDSTSDSIRGAFGIEVEGLNTQPETPFSGLEVEGLKSVFQNGRWEYVDQNDGLIAGFWDDKEGKYEHTADILKGEWKGLFVSQSLEETWRQSLSDEELTAENWNSRKIKMPIPFNISEGGIVEKIKALGSIIVAKKPFSMIGFRDLPSGSVIFSPFSPDYGGILYGFEQTSDGKIKNPDITLIRDPLLLYFNFNNPRQCLIANNDFPINQQNNSEDSSKRLVLGSPFLQVEKNEEVEESFINKVNPFLKNSYQVVMSLSFGNGGNALDFSFDNLLRDEKGRFIFINPTDAETEEQLKLESNIELKEETEKNVTNIEITEREAPEIDGLILNKEDGFYLTDDSNKYGIPENEKVGIFDNGFLGLDFRMIDFLQQKAKDDGQFKFPLPFDPRDLKNIEFSGNSGNGDIMMIKLNSNVSIYSPLEGNFFKVNGRTLVNRETNEWEDYEGLIFEIEKGKELRISSNSIDFLREDGNTEVGEILAKTDGNITLEFPDISKSILKINGIKIFIFAK